jgi:hypothetical protein
MRKLIRPRKKLAYFVILWPPLLFLGAKLTTYLINNLVVAIGGLDSSDYTPNPLLQATLLVGLPVYYTVYAKGAFRAILLNKP